MAPVQLFGPSPVTQHADDIVVRLENTDDDPPRKMRARSAILQEEAAVIAAATAAGVKEAVHVPTLGNSGPVSCTGWQLSFVFSSRDG